MDHHFEVWKCCALRHARSIEWVRRWRDGRVHVVIHPEPAAVAGDHAPIPPDRESENDIMHGDKNLGSKRGFSTRFTGENAGEMGRRGNAVRIANIPLRRCLKGIATESMYNHPPFPDGQLKPVADFYHIAVKDVTFAHVAIFKQCVEMAKGDPHALNLVAAYAGEKPTENISVTAPDFSALDAAFEALKDSNRKE